MGGLFLFAFGLLLGALVLAVGVSAIIIVMLHWKWPNMDEKKAIGIAARFIPIAVVILMAMVTILEYFSSEPVSSSEVQGGMILAIIGVGLVLYGYLVGLVSARFVSSRTKR